MVQASVDQVIKLFGHGNQRRRLEHEVKRIGQLDPARKSIIRGLSSKRRRLVRELHNVDAYISALLDEKYRVRFKSGLATAYSIDKVIEAMGDDVTNTILACLPAVLFAGNKVLAPKAVFELDLNFVNNTIQRIRNGRKIPSAH